MKDTGIVRTLDDLGRLNIPKEIRTAMAIPENGKLEIFVHGEMIVLKKYRPSSDAVLLEALQMVCDEVGKNPKIYIEKAREGGES